MRSYAASSAKPDPGSPTQQSLTVSFAFNELRAATGYPVERLRRLGYPVDVPDADDAVLPETLPRSVRVLLCVGRFAR